MDKYMQKTLKLCEKSFKNGDVPVAAMIIKDDKIISQAYNRKYKDHDVTAHAEILALRKACRKLKTNYLNDCIMYVSLEPCMMCTSAIVQSHIKKIIYCTDSPKYGFMIENSEKFNIECIKMYDSSYEEMLKNFFKDKR